MDKFICITYIYWYKLNLIIIYKVFNYCKIPQKSNADLAFATQKILVIPIILYLLFSIWTLGNSAIFYEVRKKK